MKGYFCSDTVFNLSNKVLTEDEIKIIEKGLDFAPIQRKVNEAKFRQDFENFANGWGLSEILEMKPLTTLVKDQRFCLNHHGNHR